MTLIYRATIRTCVYRFEFARSEVGPVGFSPTFSGTVRRESRTREYFALVACLQRRCQLVSCLDYPKDPLVLSLRSQPREKPGSPRVERALLAVRRRQTKLSSGSTVSLAAPRLIPLMLAGLDRRPTARVSSPGGDGWRLRAGCGGAPAEMSWIPPAAPQRSIRSARRNVTATILLATLGAPLVRLDFLLSVISGSRTD